MAEHFGLINKKKPDIILSALRQSNKHAVVLGSSSEALEKKPQRSPEFIVELKDKQANATDRVTFECKVVGEPEPQITWLHGDEKLVEEPNKITIENLEGVQRLILENVAVEDEGRYACVAENLAGSTTTEAKLKVESINFYVILIALLGIRLISSERGKIRIENNYKIDSF